MGIAWGWQLAMAVVPFVALISGYYAGRAACQRPHLPFDPNALLGCTECSCVFTVGLSRKPKVRCPDCGHEASLT